MKSPLKILVLAALSAYATQIPVNIKITNKKGEAHAFEQLQLRGQINQYDVSLDGAGSARVQLSAGDQYRLWYKNFMGELELCKQCQEIQLPNNIDPSAEGSFQYWYDSKSIRLDVKFAVDKAALNKDAKTLEILDKTAKFLIESPQFIIEIAGHTDDQGNDAYNMKLSLARAETVREYLISKGVPATQLTAKGYGESSPLVAGTSKQARDANRRTEAVVLQQ